MSNVLHGFHLNSRAEAFLRIMVYASDRMIHSNYLKQPCFIPQSNFAEDLSS